MNYVDYIAVVCATIIFTWSSLFEAVRKLVGFYPGLVRFLACPMCIGFWAGALASAFRRGIAVDPWLHFVTACIVSVASFALFLGLERLRGSEKVSAEKALANHFRNMDADTPVSLTLPGWFCPNCKVFNGEAKERLSICRACSERRPG